MSHNACKNGRYPWQNIGQREYVEDLEVPKHDFVGRYVQAYSFIHWLHIAICISVDVLCSPVCRLRVPLPSLASHATVLIHSKARKDAVRAKFIDDATLAIHDKEHRLPTSLNASIPPFETILSFVNDRNLRKGSLSGSIYVFCGTAAPQAPSSVKTK